MINPETFMADLQRRLAESPHRCSAGCGERMTRPDEICSACEALRDRKKALDAKWRAKCPQRYRDARFDAPDVLRTRVSDAHAIVVARTALDHHTVVLLLGPPGAGKSTLACALAAQWVEPQQWKHAEYLTAFKLATARGEHGLGDGEPDAVHAAKRADLLVLDDIGQEPITPQSAVIEVVHHRHERELHLIVTSAIGRKALGERYGGGFARRLLEGACIIEVKSTVRAA